MDTPTRYLVASNRLRAIKVPAGLQQMLATDTRRKAQVSPPPEPGTSNEQVTASQRLAALFGPLAEPRIWPFLHPRGLDLSFPLSPASENHSLDAYRPLIHALQSFLFPSLSLRFDNPAPLIVFVPPNPHFLPVPPEL
ncbi:uncharacterized protein TrAtP1_007889 [Trichoderma atroviride]|uniref:uncharacterized protein n=1 Tax=Hypocrea atroviridis TaxID=63577 RepID=UPI00331C3B2F|nr:hypothetical protein TrAtP1_007889 [Trichoderma atroviride]